MLPPFGHMLTRSLLTALCLIAAVAPASAGEVRPRLVAGGMNPVTPELRTELFSTKNGFSAGAASGEASSPDRGRMALGGYAAFAFSDMTLSSSFKDAGDTSVADFSAAYTGFAADSVATFRLGYEWGRAQAFSVNPAQAGLTAFTGGLDAGRPMGDLSMTLSFTHDVTPALSFGGYAAASHAKEDERNSENSLRFGAGLGYKF
ncbi:MAG TPA: hypothetical protein VK196_06650 [Magnetospirillum sp.]|nr:hypothetical protein [Magnetospirillum sp.]